MAATTYATAQVTLDPLTTFSLPPHQPSIPATYDPASQKLSFIGVMTPAEQTDLKRVAGNPSAAIDELFQIPRLAVKFYQPSFTAPLEILPSIVDFKAQLSADLAAKISYDAEQRLLLFSGIMTK